MPAIPMWFHYTALLSVLAYVLCRGQWEERVAMIYYLSINIASVLAGNYTNNAITVDIVFQIFDLIVFFSIMLISKKYWTIIAGGIGLLEVATALARVVYPTTIWASETVMVIWFYSFLLAVLLATRRLHVHRRGATDLAFDAGGATDKLPVRHVF